MPDTTAASNENTVLAVPTTPPTVSCVNPNKSFTSDSRHEMCVADVHDVDMHAAEEDAPPISSPAVEV